MVENIGHFFLGDFIVNPKSVGGWGVEDVFGGNPVNAVGVPHMFGNIGEGCGSGSRKRFATDFGEDNGNHATGDGEISVKNCGRCPCHEPFLCGIADVGGEIFRGMDVCVSGEDGFYGLEGDGNIGIFFGLGEGEGIFGGGNGLDVFSCGVCDDHGGCGEVFIWGGGEGDFFGGVWC